MFNARENAGSSKSGWTKIGFLAKVCQAALIFHSIFRLLLLCNELPAQIFGAFHQQFSLLTKC